MRCRREAKSDLWCPAVLDLMKLHLSPCIMTHFFENSEPIASSVKQDRKESVRSAYEPPDNRRISSYTLIPMFTNSLFILGDLNAKHPLWESSVAKDRDTNSFANLTGLSKSRGKIMSLLADFVSASPTPRSSRWNISTILRSAFRWNWDQQIKQVFWKRWSKDCAHPLQSRPELYYHRTNLQVGYCFVIHNTES
ncbi:hypothetical protein TNCV_1635001 [Trichonephila clavipes]|nr:hypothetical protein TNCV_1635001 [Trichonephila clavipes]